MSGLRGFDRFGPQPGGVTSGSQAADIAVFRPSNGTWYVRDEFTVRWGSAGDVPLSMPPYLYHRYFE